MSETVKRGNRQNLSELRQELAEKQKILNNALRELNKLETQLRERNLRIRQLKQASNKAAAVSLRWYHWYLKRFPQRVEHILSDLEVPDGGEFAVYALAAIRSDPEIRELMAERRREKRSGCRKSSRVKVQKGCGNRCSQAQQAPTGKRQTVRSGDEWTRIFHELGGGN